jgi:hypothetical protein
VAAVAVVAAVVTVVAGAVVAVVFTAEVAVVLVAVVEAVVFAFVDDAVGTVVTAAVVSPSFSEDREIILSLSVPPSFAEVIFPHEHRQTVSAAARITLFIQIHLTIINTVFCMIIT